MFSVTYGKPGDPHSYDCFDAETLEECESELLNAGLPLDQVWSKLYRKPTRVLIAGDWQVVIENSP